MKQSITVLAIIFSSVASAQRYPTDGIILDTISQRIYKVTQLPGAKSGSAQNNRTDQTAVLKSALAEAGSASVSLSVSGGGSIIINGEVTVPRNKHLVFAPGTKITGKGIIRGGIIDAGEHQQIFDTTVTVIPEATTTGYLSAMWWGAKGDGATDDWAALQSAINAGIAGNVRNVKIPFGTYRIRKGLLLRQGDNQFLNGFTLYGEMATYGGPAGQTIIKTSNNQNFIIGVQKGKGVRIKNLTVSGANTALAKLSLYDVLENPKTDFVNGCRNNTTSPHAGFIIDPFTNGPGYAPTERYPGFESYYVNEGNGGSTDVVFQDCRAEYCISGFCFSPHGRPQNGDAIVMNNCWSDYNKCAISIGQSQNRSIQVNNFKCWGWVETVFDCQNYSDGTADNPEVDGLNVAGAVRYLCRLSGYANKGLTIKRGHIESVYMLGGNFKGNYSGDLLLYDTWIQLQPNSGAGTENQSPIHDASTQFFGGTLKMINCYISKYAGYGLPIKINAKEGVFEKCTFDYIPFNTYSYGQMNFRDCTGGGSNYPWGTQDIIYGRTPAELNGYPMIFLNGMSWQTSIPNRYIPDGAAYSSVRYSRPNLFNAGYSISAGYKLYPIGIEAPINIQRDALTADFPITEPENYRKTNPGDIILSYGIRDEFGETKTVSVLGVVKAKDNGKITLCYTAKGLDGNGRYPLLIARQPFLLENFMMGDITSGSPVINNVILEDGATAISSINGTTIQSVYFPAGTFILSHTSNSITLSNNAKATAKGIDIISSDYTQIEYGVANPSSVDKQGYKRGDIVYNIDFVNYPDVIQWNCVKSGICNSVYPPVFKAIYSKP